MPNVSSTHATMLKNSDRPAFGLPAPSLPWKESCWKVGNKLSWLMSPSTRFQSGLQPWDLLPTGAGAMKKGANEYGVAIETRRFIPRTSRKTLPQKKMGNLWTGHPGWSSFGSRPERGNRQGSPGHHDPIGGSLMANGALGFPCRTPSPVPATIHTLLRTKSKPGF